MRGSNTYSKWLGLPDDCVSPTHYQVLGLDEWEKDQERIRDSAVQRSELVRKYQMGPDADKALQVLRMISAAFACLSNPDRKAAYDEEQRSVGRPGDSSRQLPLQRSGIVFGCSCGRRMLAKSDFAGRLIRCRGCSQTVRVPPAGWTGQHGPSRPSDEVERSIAIMPLAIVVQDDEDGAHNASFPQWLILVICGTGLVLLLLLTCGIYDSVARKAAMQIAAANEEVHALLKAANKELDDGNNEPARAAARRALSIDRATNKDLAIRLIAEADQADHRRSEAAARAGQLEHERALASERQRTIDEEQREREVAELKRTERQEEHRAEYAKLSGFQQSTVDACEQAFSDIERKVDILVLGCKIVYEDIRKESNPDKRRYREEDLRIKTNASINEADAELTRCLSVISTRIDLPRYFEQRWTKAKDEHIRRLTRASSGIDVE